MGKTGVQLMERVHRNRGACVLARGLSSGDPDEMQGDLWRRDGSIWGGGPHPLLFAKQFHVRNPGGGGGPLPGFSTNKSNNQMSRGRRSAGSLNTNWGSRSALRAKMVWPALTTRHPVAPGPPIVVFGGLGRIW